MEAPEDEGRKMPLVKFRVLNLPTLGKRRRNRPPRSRPGNRKRQQPSPPPQAPLTPLRSYLGGLGSSITSHRKN